MDPLIGTTLGPCRIEALIGLGGMGAVYRGHHLALDKAVAVKVISPALSRDPAAARRLLEEARAAAKLDDPRMVQIHDAGESNGVHYIVMQLLEGETLEERVKRVGGLEPGEALWIMKEVLLGLAAAHKARIVHRDVKPANIMLVAGGGVRLADFGLAAPLGGQDGGGAPAGSFDFAPPEQAFGAPPDPRSDLYSVGATYYYALTGRPPFEGRDLMELVRQHQEAPPPDARLHNRIVTSAAAELIMRLMDKFPDRRPQSAEAVLTELDSHRMHLEVDQSGSPHKLLPPEPAPREGFDPRTMGLPSLDEPLLSDGPALPPPPPPVLIASVEPTWSARAIFVCLLGIFFSKPWAAAAQADLLACAIASLGVCGLFLAKERPGGAAKAGGVSAFIVMAAALAAFALPGLSVRPPLELQVTAGLGLALGLAALYVGLWDDEEKDYTSAGLLALSGAALLACALALRRPPDTALLAGTKRVLLEACSSFLSSGGLLRWAGVLVLYLGGSAFLIPRPKPDRKAARRVLNWNA